MSANVSSPANFPKWPFWRVLKFAKNGKFLASTRIQQIRRRVAIAYFRVKKNIGYDSMKCNNPYSLNEKQNTIILISFEIRFCTLIWRKKNRLAIFWEVTLKVITQFHQKIRRKKNQNKKQKTKTKVRRTVTSTNPRSIILAYSNEFLNTTWCSEKAINNFYFRLQQINVKTVTYWWLNFDAALFSNVSDNFVNCFSFRYENKQIRKQTKMQGN